MLILTRKTNESIIIDDVTEIMVVDIKGDQVKIGIKAPKSVRIFRGEIYEEIQKENIEAAKTQVPKDLDSLLPPSRRKKK